MIAKALFKYAWYRGGANPHLERQCYLIAAQVLNPVDFFDGSQFHESNKEATKSFRSMFWKKSDHIKLPEVLFYYFKELPLTFRLTSENCREKSEPNKIYIEMIYWHDLR